MIFDIDINDKRNGIWLPNTESARVSGTTATPHKGTGVHEKAYKQHVFNKLSAANNREEFLTALSDVKRSLFDGVSFKAVR